MTLSVAKSCSLFVLLFLFCGTSSQTTRPPDVIGYVVERGHPIITVRCGDEGDTVETYTSSPGESVTTEFLSCYRKSQDPYPYPIPCGSMKVIESWPDRGSTRGIIDCMPKNIPTSVSRLYRNEPENLPKGCEKIQFPGCLQSFNIVQSPTRSLRPPRPRRQEIVRKGARRIEGQTLIS